MRPISRDCDEHEHTKPTKFYESMWQASAAADIQVGNDRSKKADGAAASAPRRANLMTVLSTEELCWGDAGLYLSTPDAGLGGAAVMAAGTPEQKERFLDASRKASPSGARWRSRSRASVPIRRRSRPRRLATAITG